MMNFRIGWRLLLQQPTYSMVVIGGLAVGFAACFLIFSYVLFCLNFNGAVPDNDRVVMVKQRMNIFPVPIWMTGAYLPLRDVALASGMVSEASIAVPISKTMRVGDKVQMLYSVAVDPSFPAMFGVHARQGDLQAALQHPDGLALTQGSAAKLFGGAPAVGQGVYIDGTLLQVRAVLADPPPNSTQRYDALVGPHSSAWAGRDTAFSEWKADQLFLKLRPGASIAALTPVLQAAADHSPFDESMKKDGLGKMLNGRNVTDIRLTSLRDLYFDEDLAASGDSGNRNSVLGLAAGGMLILLLATINYVNLATVRTLRRQREIGLRKLLGASTGQLVRQFLSEAVLITVLAAALGVVLAWLLLPIFSDLVNRHLNGIIMPQHLLMAFGFAIFIGIFAGIYPARLACYALPATALTGRGNSETVAGLWLRRVLTVLQFSSAMALSAGMLAVGWQTWYASHASPGFDPANLLLLRLPYETEGKPAADAFIEQLGRLPGVSGVATISEAVGREDSKVFNSLPAKGGNDIMMDTVYVSPNWFDLMQLQAAAGQAFSTHLDPHDDKDSGGIMLNAAGARALGFETPEAAVGQTLSNTLRITGIAPELRFHGLSEQSPAIVYRVRPGRVVTVRSGVTLDEAYRLIAPVWQRNFPNAILEITTQQAALEERYADDGRLMRILAISSITAIALAAFGIYVLSAYSVQRNRRQIVLRKLHGAGGKDIALMLGREFSVLVGAGAIIGLPLAAVATQRYLAGYTEHAPVGIWTPAAALLLAIVVALLATTRHTLTAMRMPPLLALKD
ncbi:FtsX-like permease family protein [Duganella sp. FT134W]|uniref:FtsX-like permease family protein n=1 Tax=Duganella margarita TaxID=2692170 RepID=A0A7X4H338_9BURK|nr:FtsX-like permease family protein [Duganella margarita]MYM73412.1 FtsX-like permease family protein [Duganella margarita]